MQYRTLGRTGWRVSEIGLGTWGMGGMWGPVNDREALEAIHRALESGVNFLDTALVYGDGHAEGLIRKALANRTAPVYLATKIPPKNMAWPARHDVPVTEAFPAQWIVQCTEQSLRHLKRDHVDLQQFHVWSSRWLIERAEWLPAIERLKREGKIRAFGVSINDHEPDTALALVASGLIDTVQLIYNLFEQAPAQTLLPLCQQYQVGVIVRVPFDEGSLTGTLTADTRFHPDDWRRAYFRGDRLQETLQRVERLAALVRGESPTLARAALKFCLSHPAVSTVIPGMRRVAHVEENCAASDGTVLSPQLLRRLRAHAWSRNFYPFAEAASPLTP